MAIRKKKHPYYNYNRLLSYNATYNFCVGGRGLGKTYGAKKNAVKKFFRSGEQFIYLRRYKTELAAAKDTFFTDFSHEFPGQDFRVFGGTAQTAPAETRSEKKREWRIMGYFIALSVSQSQQSVSFPMVTTIIFDEFIIHNGLVPYLKNEATVMLNFYSTVDRYQDKTRVFFIANSVSVMNPYFSAYKIRPDEMAEWEVLHGGFIVCHFPNSEEFQTSVYETEFGKFIKNTEYAEFAVSNTFADNHDALIRPKDSKAHYLYTLETESGTFSVWHNIYSNEYTVQEKLPKDQKILTLVPQKMDRDKFLLTFNDKQLQHLRTAFRTGRVNFDIAQTRNAFTEIFKR